MARLVQGLGHQAQRIAPRFVKSFVRSNKNDFADAQAIWYETYKPIRADGALGQPDEVARAVLFLVPPESRYIAGVELFVDGDTTAV